MPAIRVLVNTPAPQGSTGITTNVFPVDDAGLRRGGRQQHLRQRGPAAPDQHQAAGVRGAQARRGLRNAAGLRQGARWPGARSPAAVPIDRAAVVSAVERYLASRGIAVSRRSGAAPRLVLRCSTPAPAQAPVQQSVVASVAAEVVDRFLARRGTRTGRQSRQTSAATAD